MILASWHKERFSFLDESILCHQKRESFHQEHEGGGSESTDMVSYTNLIPTYITGMQGWVEAYLAEAMSLSASHYTTYTGTTYAVQNADETDGIAALALRGSGGAAIETDGKTYLKDLYDGLKINTNSKIAAYYAKKIEALLEEFDDSIMPMIQHQHVFSFGGSDHNVAEALASKLMMAKISETAKMFYEDYIQERRLMHEGVAHATPYGLQCVRDGEMLRQAGIFEREYAQGALTDAWEKWNEDEILPIRNLDIAGNAIRTVLSTYRQTSTKFYGPSTAATIAGVAMTGLSLYAMYSGTSMNPYMKGGIAALSKDKGTTDLSQSKATLQWGGAKGGASFGDSSLTSAAEKTGADNFISNFFGGEAG